MNVYTIPATVSFVDALAAGLLEKSGGDPLALANITVLLPNRRAVRSLREAFLRKSSGKPLLLPAIRPIGDVDEDAMVLGLSSRALEEVRVPIDPLRRQLVLAQYLHASDPDRFTLAQALPMAAELGRFLDSVHTEGLTLDRLDTLVPADYAEHWKISLNFLKKVVGVFWPRQLERENALDPGRHRNQMIAAYTQSLVDAPPAGPIIAAGSTGSIPATAELLKVIANLPNGSVVLPGLDMRLDDEAWTQIEEGHPQAGLANLLLKMGITRTDVKPWDGTASSTREDLISTLMRPAATLDAWTANPVPPAAFENLKLIEAETLDEEAGAIAAIMRDHADDENASEPCVLVTPDRILAGRVAHTLARWNITIDDSAGIPLSNTPAGAWLLLLADVLANGLAPVELLAALKHPLAAGGATWPRDAPFRTFVRELDLHLRGPRPAPGLSGLRAHLSDAGLDTGLRALEKLFAPIALAIDAPARLRALVLLAENLAATPEMSGAQRLWSGDAGEAAANTIAIVLQQADVLPALDWTDVRAVLEAAMKPVSVRPRFGTHPRLAILGPIEARLYQAGKMILGGLNEGAWPRLAEVDGWMSRPMRRAFGLPAPERAITLSSHDFCQSLGAAQVILTRSKNRDGAPTIPSRWLQRLHAVCAATGNIDITDHTWLSITRQLDTPAEGAKPVKRPEVNPPREARPAKLRVTEIAKLRADPYGIYARHVLGLSPLDPLDTEPDHRDRGTLIHKALEEYTKAFPKQLPADATQRLIAIGKDVFAKAQAHPDVTGHWWPRYLRMAKALVTFENSWRADLVESWCEADATMTVQTKTAPFELRGRADRIEKRKNGWAVIDYKSGGAPSGIDVKTGIEPQLTLLGAMLLNGCFNAALAGQAPDTIETLAYWPAGGTQDVFKPANINVPDRDALCREALDGLEALVRAYLDDGIPYICWPDPDVALRDDYEYAHLGRIAEWATDTDAEAA